MSNGTCLMWASFVLCIFRSVKAQRNLLHDSSLLKNTCVRQVVFDRRFSLVRSPRGALQTCKPGVSRLGFCHSVNDRTRLLCLVFCFLPESARRPTSSGSTGPASASLRLRTPEGRRGRAPGLGPRRLRHWRLGETKLINDSDNDENGTNR